MKRIVYLFFVVLYYYPLIAQDSTQVNYKLGSARIQILNTCFGPSDTLVSFINVHENERTSVDAAEEFLMNYGGNLMVLKHSGNRYITFYLRKKKYFIDPNRIYTKKGIAATLKRLSHYNAEAAKEVERFSTHLLKHFVDGKNLVIALHNNTDLNYSINSYLNGGEEAINAAMVHINEEMDEDDFIVTTDSTLFDRIKDLNINVVLQDNIRAVDDGSLSVYAAKKNIPYINIEAQEGHREEQLAMMQALQEIIKEYAMIKPGD